MKASDLMTRTVVSVTPDTSVKKAIEILLKHHISAVPVVDASGVPVGIVSESDMIDQSLDSMMARRDWWLEVIAEGNDMSPAFAEYVKKTEILVSKIMKSPVITAEENVSIDDIAQLLHKNKIKRVPIVKDGKIVGIISRSDLLRVVAEKLG